MCDSLERTAQLCCEYYRSSAEVAAKSNFTPPTLLSWVVDDTEDAGGAELCRQEDTVKAVEKLFSAASAEEAILLVQQILSDSRLRVMQKPQAVDGMCSTHVVKGLVRCEGHSNWTNLVDVLLQIVRDKLRGYRDVPDWFAQWENELKRGCLTLSFLQFVYLPLFSDATVSPDVNLVMKKRIVAEVISNEDCGAAVLQHLSARSSHWNEDDLEILESMKRNESLWVKSIPTVISGLCDCRMSTAKSTRFAKFLLALLRDDLPKRKVSQASLTELAKTVEVNGTLYKRACQSYLDKLSSGSQHSSVGS